MKTSLSFLLLLSAGLASAQLGAQRRDDRPEFRPRLEGLYTSVQRNNTVYRTLRLGRDGLAEIVTEFRGTNPERDRREGGVRLSDRDVDRYGVTAQRAARGRAVRQRGRWDLRDRRIVLSLDGLGERNGDRRIDLTLERRDGELVIDRDTDLYGKQKLAFRREGGWGGGRPGRGDDDRAEYGYLQYDRERLRIDGIDLVDGRDSEGRLIVRTPSRRIELRGEVRRRGEGVVFRSDDGEFTLRLRNGVVESVRGAGTVDRHRIEFVEER